MEDRSKSKLKVMTVNYRNGIYQGEFENVLECRQGVGLIFTTDNHMIMGSHWHQDYANSSTFIFYNHSHYIYGFWQANLPHGFNAIRMNDIVILAFYDMGVIVGRMLVLFQKYSLAAVLQKNSHTNLFQEVQKGDLFSDQDFNNYITACGWIQFQQNWKTLIKFIPVNFNSQRSQKKQKLKLRLVNDFYRFGFDEGIAIVFDDEYRVISSGVHKKAKLSSLGVRFDKQNFVQEGNFGKQSQVYAFNYGHRPQHKLGKIYNNNLLRSTQFVNKYLGNPAKILINYIEELIKSNLFRKIISGQITLRKLNLSLGSQQDAKLKFETNRLIEKEQNFQKMSQKQRLKEEKARLQLYKRELYESINKKSRVSRNQQNIDKIKQLTPQKIQTNNGSQSPVNQIIHKLPVQIAIRSSKRKEINDNMKTKSRSPIFTPQKGHNRQTSESKVSPFKQKMRSKIFNQDKSAKKKRFVYQPIQAQLYPKLSQQVYHNYFSPHQQIDISKFGALQVNQQVLPISVRKQKLKSENQSPQKLAKQAQKSDKYAAIQKNNKMKQRSNKILRKNQTQRQAITSIRESNPTFRAPYDQASPTRNYTNTNTPNIIISSPNKNKSVSKKKKIIIPQPKNSQTQNMIYGRKNDVYLKGERAVIQVSPDYKGKKKIKGSTYLEKYHQSKNKTQNMVKKMQEGTLQNNKYNRTIKIYNQNNRVYQKIQNSPSQKYDTKNSYGNKTQIVSKQKYDKYQMPESYEGRKNTGDRKEGRRNHFQGISPIRLKYQYIYE